MTELSNKLHSFAYISKKAFTSSVEHLDLVLQDYI